MTYSSNPLPLEFWTRLEARLAAEYRAQLSRLAESTAPLQVTVDTGLGAVQQAQQARAAVFAQVRELENIQLLMMVLGGQVRTAIFHAEILDVEAHIQCLRNIAELFGSTLVSLPRRLPREQQIQSLLTEYNALRNLGTGEITMQERKRLRDMTVELPVVGAEDTAEHERTLRTLQSNIDQKDAELQNLKVSTLMSLRVSPDLAGLVQSFGVQMTEDVPPPALMPVDTPALPAE